MKELSRAHEEVNDGFRCRRGGRDGAISCGFGGISGGGREGVWSAIPLVASDVCLLAPPRHGAAQAGWRLREREREVRGLSPLEIEGLKEPTKVEEGADM